MGVLSKARKDLNKKVVIQLYHSFVFPYSIYCSEVWGTASDINLQESLIKLQTKMVRIRILYPYNSLTKTIPPLKKYIFQRLALQMFRYEFGIIPIALPNLFGKK